MWNWNWIPEFSTLLQKSGDTQMWICLPADSINKLIDLCPGIQIQICIAVDAFSLTWSNELIYAIPPFSLIGRLVQKLRQDQGEMVLVAPVWLTQGWFTAAMELLTDLPWIFKVQQDTLSLTYSDRIHPLINHLHLMVCRLSGKSIKAETFRRQLQMSSCPPGELLQRSNIPHILTDGFYTVIKGKLINFLPL